MIGNPNPFTFIGPTKTPEEYYQDWSLKLSQREEALVAKESGAAMLKRENAQWLRFAEALVAGGRFSGGPERHATEIALWADAMLEEAKKRGRV